METQTYSRSGVEIVKICGSLDMYSATEFKEILQSTFRLNPHKILLDISECRHIDSSALAVIISFNNQLQSNGNRLRLFLDKQKSIIFHHFSLEKKLSLHYSIDSAINSF